MNSARLPIIQTEDQPEMSKNKRPKLVPKRKKKENSQTIRSIFQIAFLLLNLLIGFQFFLWVKFYETGGRSWSVDRPAGVEGWLPIASLMNLKAWILTGELPEIHPAGIFLLVSFILISFFFRKSFCSWLCPVGTISETLWGIGQKLFGRNFLLPKWLDFVLRGLKYLLLGLFVYAISSMSVVAIRQFLDGPYGIVADVKMLNFFRQMTATTAIVVGILVLLSLVVKNFWCRYLCPYGAMLGLFSWISPVRIHRDENSCVSCGKCAKVCPARLPVNLKENIRSPECLGCYLCVADCPVEGALEMTAGRKTVVQPKWVAAGILVIFLGLVLGARISGHWHTQLQDEVYFELVPDADKFSHP